MKKTRLGTSSSEKESPQEPNITISDSRRDSPLSIPPETSHHSQESPRSHPYPPTG